MGNNLIRSGTEADFESIIDMASNFWERTIYNEDFCEDTVQGMLSVCLDQELLSVVENDGVLVGFACAFKGGLLGNSAIATGTELAWWVEPDHRGGKNGISLLKHLEDLAAKAGIKYWNMAFMCSCMPDIVEDIYKKMGYVKSEVIYTKVLGD